MCEAVLAADTANVLGPIACSAATTWFNFGIRTSNSEATAARSSLTGNRTVLTNGSELEHTNGVRMMHKIKGALCTSRLHKVHPHTNFFVHPFVHQCAHHNHQFRRFKRHDSPGNVNKSAALKRFIWFGLMAKLREVTLNVYSKFLVKNNGQKPLAEVAAWRSRDL